MATFTERYRGGDAAEGARPGRTTSLRSVVTAAVSFLVLGVTAVTGTLFARHERMTLENELRLRLVAQGRNVASLASKSLLDDFPEFTLHPLVKKLRAENPDWEYLVIADEAGRVKGAESMSLVDAPFSEPATLVPAKEKPALGDGESLREDERVYQLGVPVRFQDGSLLGNVYLGLSKAHVHAVVADAVRRTAGVTAVVLIVGLALSSLLASRIVEPVRQLTRGAEELGRGNLAHRIVTADRTELGRLAWTFNDMAGRLEIAQREMVEKERIRRELEIAHELEQKLLPAGETSIPGWEIAAFHRSAEEVGGDYYDVVPLGNERYGLAIGDVAGKGIPGLVVMAMAGVLLRSHAPAYASPTALLSKLNELIQPSMKRGMFITLFYGILDARRGTFVFASAGHNPLLYYSRANEVCLPIATTGMPLGLVRGERFEKKLADQTLELEPGDLLVEYTDGVNEATDSSDTEFGVERITKGFTGAESAPAREVVDRLAAEVDAFSAGNPQSDDITIIAIRRLDAAASDSAPERAEAVSS